MLRTLVERIELVPNGDELAIVLRGDLAAILRFACGKKNPDFMGETAALEELMGQGTVSEAQKRKKPHGGGLLGSQGSLVAGKRNTRLLRNGTNEQGDPLGSPSIQSQGCLVAGARNQRFLRLVERHIPRLAA